MHALIMLPPAGGSAAEKWVAEGRTACAKDLARRISSINSIESLIAVVASDDDLDHLTEIGVDVRRSPEKNFNFGAALADLIEREGIQDLAYFGGASAPLLEQASLEELVDRVRTSEGPCAIANNLHSTDWMIVKGADHILAHSHRLPTDNPLGWVLSREAGLRVESLEPSAATRLDIDTPTDLLMAVDHPALGTDLSEFLAKSNIEALDRIGAIRDLISKPATTLAVIGRASAHAWQTLVASTQIWVRLYVEERGMVASQRLKRGEVRSLIGEMLDTLGPAGFITRLGQMADGCLWDTRVWMGTLNEWPSDADRFAADLGWVDEIRNQPLRELTESVERADMPILCGGYGVVGGGLYALLEGLQEQG